MIIGIGSFFVSKQKMNELQAKERIASKIG